MDKDYEAEQWHPYLRELWFPVEIQASNLLVIEQPARAQFTPGQLLSVMGPVGQPFAPAEAAQHFADRIQFDAVRAADDVGAAFGTAG